MIQDWLCDDDDDDDDDGWYLVSTYCMYTDIVRAS